MTNPIHVTYLILFLVGVVLLQIFLSRRQNKWAGLILPAIWLIVSVLFILFRTVNADESWFWQVASSFLLLNIPTAVLLVIYFICREKFLVQKQVEKMNIQDLD